MTDQSVHFEMEKVETSSTFANVPGASLSRAFPMTQTRHWGHVRFYYENKVMQICQVCGNVLLGLLFVRSVRGKF